MECLYRAGSLKTAESQLANYKFDLVAVQLVGLHDGGSKPYSYGNEKAKHHLGEASSYVRVSDHQSSG
jgi:hypothetical protein